MIRHLLPTVVACALTVAPAFGEDACLTGASALADQRAIVTLRTDTDARCPCATAASKGTYRRCGKDVLEAALTGATLRTACQTTVKRDIKTASCGTNRIPCGRVQESAVTPVSCRSKAASACIDRTKYDQTACDEQTRCSDVVEWAAGTCSDVRARGPYEAGVRTIIMTKQSVVDPMQPRELDTVVWYPTTAGAGPIDAATGGVLNAPVDGSGGPYPVLLFSHGSCGYPLQSTFLLPLIASRGYIVVAPPHPGNTLFEYPTCGTQTAQLNSAFERPQDIIFALDQMLAANADDASPFFGTLDANRIGMSGHSFGGFTTFFVLNLDPRFKVAVPMAPATPAANATFHVPSLMMLGAIDSVVNNAAARQAYESSTGPKYKVEIAHAGHYAFSNACFPSADCNPPTTLTQAEAHGPVLRWVIPFLEWKLRGDERFAAFFDAPAPVGVDVAAVP